MNLRDSGSAFADRAADTLHRTGAHIADCENAGHARLQRSGHVIRVVTGRLLTGPHKAMQVDRDATALQPAGLRIRADKKEHMTNRVFFFDTGSIVAPGHRRETFQWVPVKLGELGVRPQLDVRCGTDTVYQIT